LYPECKRKNLDFPEIPNLKRAKEFKSMLMITESSWLLRTDKKRR
jgi:hypothetical protein